ncbi:hypothetical protein VNI00_011870 [Paramarasmius palmivorus]|uniref:SET domain-containing protein n=1 Tax=Paramarasmius palmivorus TaxID=297713 RepID=A0AAW0C8V8_9AGAR
MKRKRTPSSSPSRLRPLARDPLSSLLKFCAENGIKIDDRFEMRYSSPEGAETRPIGVFLKNGVDDIPVGTDVVYIPKTAVLSVKSTRLEELELPSDYEPVPFGVGAQLALALALYIEETKGPHSRWHSYIQSLPAHLVDLPTFWGSDNGNENDSVRREDTEIALSWLRGTEVEYNIGRGLLDSIDSYYQKVVVPVFKHNIHISPSLQDFRHAYSLVSSRAFIVDAYNGLSMVPVADAFNHTSENHVQLESEYDVCPECGSLKQCPHDRDIDSSSGPSSGESNADTEELYYTMTATSYITGNGIDVTEIFNTYGAQLSNAELMAQYGFILDANEADWIGWDEEEVIEFVQGNKDKHEVVMELWKECQSHFMGDKLVDTIGDSSVFYVPAEGAGASRRNLSINSDGRLSVQLLILIAVAWAMDNCEKEDITSFLLDCLGDLLRAGEQAEKELGSTGVTSAVMDLAIRLCQNRLGRMRAGEGDAGTILDETPSTMWRTRMAITQVMAEHAMLLSFIEQCLQ